MKQKFILHGACYSLMFLFAYTAFSKLGSLQQFEDVLWQAPWLGFSAPLLARAVPVTELVVVFLLLFSATRLRGLYASVALLALFTLYLGAMLLFSPHLPCQCGGVLSTLDWTQHILLNTVFAFAGLCGIRAHRLLNNSSLQQTDAHVNTTGMDTCKT